MESSVPDAATSFDDPHDLAASEHGRAHDRADVYEREAGEAYADYDCNHSWEHDTLHTEVRADD